MHSTLNSKRRGGGGYRVNGWSYSLLLSRLASLAGGESSGSFRAAFVADRRVTVM